MENNSQPPAPAAPAKVTPPAANETPKTTQASSNHAVVPMAARTAATDGSAAQPQRGTAVGSVQQHPQPLSSSMLQVLALAGTGTGAMCGPTAQCGAAMPRSPTAVGSLISRPLQQRNPVVFGQGSSSNNQAMQDSSSSSTQVVAVTALAAATHGPTAQHGALSRARRVVRPPKLMVTRAPSPPPPKLPVYRPPPPPSYWPGLASSSVGGNALLQSSSDTGFPVSNMQTVAPSPDQVTMAEEGSDSEGGGSSGDDVVMLDLNFPPVPNNEES